MPIACLSTHKPLDSPRPYGLGKFGAREADMKKTGVVLVMTIIAILLNTKVRGEEIVGGYLDTSNKFAVIEFNNGVNLLMKDGEVILGDGLLTSATFGKLYVVFPNGRGSVYKSGYRDKMGRFIAVPPDAYDKVVFLDQRGNIQGLIGASPKELNYFLKGGNIIEIVDSYGYLMEGLIDASAILSETNDLYENERREIFLATVNLRAGKKAAGIVDRIINLPVDGFEINEAFLDLFDLTEEETVSSLVKGIEYVAQGGDGSGGTSLVAQGGDGSGGTSLVAQGGDGSGGTSLVAQDGDGDGGVARKGIVVRGGVERNKIRIPHVNNVKAVCHGLAIFL